MSSSSLKGGAAPVATWTADDQAQLDRLEAKKSTYYSFKRAALEDVVNRFHTYNMTVDETVNGLIDNAADIMSALREYVK